MQLVEGAIGQLDPAIADRQLAAGIVYHGHPPAELGGLVTRSLVTGWV